VSEFQEQSALFQWAELNKAKYPGLELMFAVPNGQMRRGMRPEPGLKSGVPDIFLPVSKNEFHGLFIEMKCGGKKKGRLSDNQKFWLHDLGGQGYATSVCYGVDQAIETVVDYFKQKNE
tara:strand:- start:710 stop:1066 length:357 start_codon:yes stop_codon:yes gene_type:complete